MHHPLTELAGQWTWTSSLCGRKQKGKSVWEWWCGYIWWSDDDGWMPFFLNFNMPIHLDWKVEDSYDVGFKWRDVATRKHNLSHLQQRPSLARSAGENAQPRAAQHGALPRSHPGVKSHAHSASRCGWHGAFFEAALPGAGPMRVSHQYRYCNALTHWPNTNTAADLLPTATPIPPSTTISIKLSTTISFKLSTKISIDPPPHGRIWSQSNHQQSSHQHRYQYHIDTIWTHGQTTFTTSIQVEKVSAFHFFSPINHSNFDRSNSLLWLIFKPFYCIQVHRHPLPSL